MKDPPNSIPGEREFEQLTARMAKGKASVTIAHKLLVRVWYVLTKQEADRQADPHLAGLKFFAWSWKLTAEQHGGFTQRLQVVCHPR